MKKISIVFATVIAFSCNEKKETNAVNSLLSDNLKGNVQQVTTTPYQTDSTGKVGAMDSCCLSVSNFDSAGFITKFTSKDAKGNVKFEQAMTHYENGLFKELVNSTDGKLSGRITIQLDKDGKMYASAQEFDSSGKLAFFYKDITQNDYNQLTAMKQYKPDSTLKSTEETKYDKQYFKEQISKDSSGKEMSHTVAKVDDKGNQVEVSRTSTVKDPKTNKDGTSTKVTKYRYDSSDENGNWTQRTEMDEKGKPTKVEKREITYYKK